MSINIQALKAFFNSYQQHLKEYLEATNDQTDPFPTLQKNVVQIYSANVAHTLEKLDKCQTVLEQNPDQQDVKILVEKKLLQYIARAKQALLQEMQLLQLKRICFLQNRMQYWPLDGLSTKVEQLLAQLKQIIPVEFDLLPRATKEWLDEPWQEIHACSLLGVAVRQSEQASRTLLFEKTRTKATGVITQTTFSQTQQMQVDLQKTHELYESLLGNNPPRARL